MRQPLKAAAVKGTVQSLRTAKANGPESKKPVIVNYRYQNNKFIVDAVFDKAILISGVGSKQKKITLIREVE